MNLELNVYENGTVKKTCTAHTIDFEFGTVRAIMKVLKIDDRNDIGELIIAIYDVWDELVAILGQCFPEMEEEDWDHVKLKELIPILLNIAKVSFKEMFRIPQDPKN